MSVNGAQRSCPFESNLSRASAARSPNAFHYFTDLLACLAGHLYAAGCGGSRKGSRKTTLPSSTGKSATRFSPAVPASGNRSTRWPCYAAACDETQIGDGEGRGTRDGAGSTLTVEHLGLSYPSKAGASLDLRLVRGARVGSGLLCFLALTPRAGACRCFASTTRGASGRKGIVIKSTRL